MYKPNLNSQTGFALLIFLVILMGAGGFLLVGYTQDILKQVEESKFQHNQRVLKEAKQALLQFAYNYPQFNAGGPGRLPCPDHDNDGDIDFPLDCDTVGRFPWIDTRLNFYRALDADGETLWYAVSEAFDNDGGGGGIINSATPGTITLVDQSQNIIYDGAAAGIAAIIIAPGPVISRDEDNDGIYEYTQVRGTAAQQTDPRNYLDTLNGFDNSVFLNSFNAPPNGFILGPVRELNPASPAVNSIVVNDQMIVITAAEVIEVAEKAVLQAYRVAINDYLTLTGNVYPWLYNYRDVPDVPGLSSFYPAFADFTDPTVGVGELVTYLDNFGRIPSIFGDYFTETTSDTIETELGGSISWGGPATVNGYLFLDGPPVINFPVPNKIADVSFVDIDPDVVGNDGQLTATFLTPETLTYDIYYWERDHSPYNGGWSLCAPPANLISDCSRDSSGTPIPGLPNDFDMDIIHLVVTLDFTGVVNFNMNYANAPAIAYGSATGTGHASIAGTYAGVDIISLPFLSATYERDEHYHAGDIAFDPGDGPYDSGPLNMADFGRGPLSLTIRYYPELPDWAFDNNWHNSVMMAYANNYRPDILGACIEADPLPDDGCLTVGNLAGNNDNKISILTIAGQHDWVDDGAVGFSDDVDDVFDASNADINADMPFFDGKYLFDRRELGGNDKIFVIEEI